MPHLLFGNLLPNIAEVAHLAAGEDEAGVAVKETTFEDVAGKEVSEAEPPFGDQAIFKMLAVRKR